MTLKQLEAFYWAATCTSFSRAAQRLHLSLSTLSKRIAELEESLGERLFDRTGHRAALTAVGSRLLPRAHHLLRAADEFKLELDKQPHLHGVCRFGIGELTARTWLPQLIRKLHDEHPGLTLIPSVDIGEVLERRVEAGELDFAVVAGRSSRSAVASKLIAETRFVWCAAPRLAREMQSSPPEFLARWTFVLPPTGSETTRMVEDWLVSTDTTPARCIICNHWGAIAGMLIEGIGVGVLPERWAVDLEKRGLLQSLDLQPPLAALPYSFQWRRDDFRPLTKLMLDAVAHAADFSVGRWF